MLRMLFDEPRRKDEGQLLHAFEAIRRYREKLDQMTRKVSYTPNKNELLAPARLDLWAQGFMDALDELEESRYAAGKFVQGIEASFVEDMEEPERDRYRQHIYFYKNAFIRVFSILDKLGYFLNDLYGLGTERVKPRFSYFTVLRQMHERKIQAELEQKLFDLKNAYQEPLRRLRSQRNMEIHLLNAEMVDDMMRAKHSRLHQDRQRVENLKLNIDDLDKSCEMVYRAVETVFLQAKRTTDK